MKNWISKLLDSSIIFSFDHSGFKRHCKEPLQGVDLSGLYGIVTGATSGIGLAVAKQLISEGMQCQLIGRNLQKLEESTIISQSHCLDMGDLKSVSSFAVDQIKAPIDLLVHNAGTMPTSLTVTKEGFEEMFAYFD